MTRVEVAVETLQSALAAERGGARRIELCANLDGGGTTPDAALVAAVTGRVGVPVAVIIRPRPGGFVYSHGEIRAMQRDIAAARALAVAGIVVGALSSDGRVHVELTRALVESAGGLPVTFHRAFDVTPSLPEALEDVIATGAKRLLTSGGAATALEGAEVIGMLVEQSRDRITIMAGGGIREHNVREVIARTRVREVHTRLGAGEELDERRVRRLIDLVEAER